MPQYYIKKEDFLKFLDNLSREYSVYMPTLCEGRKDDYIYSQCLKPGDFIFNPYRTVEPIKSFLSPLKEKVSNYFSDKTQEGQDKKIAIVGLKNCDIQSLKIQDYVFLQGVCEDEIYAKRRKDTLLISSDCTAFKDVCHCIGLGIMPYPEELFDLNMSPLNDSFIIDVGSKTGEGLIEKNNELFKEATNAQLTAMRLKRESVVEQLSKHLAAKKLAPKEALQKSIASSHGSDIWQNEMLTCVECGACNFICPDCHCFLLADDKKDDKNTRVRLWDSCLYANYARVAGGANPLKLRAQRLRNRFEKKFDFFPTNLKIFGCTGCGRCIEACPAKIDIREVLKKAYEYSKSNKS